MNLQTNSASVIARFNNCKPESIDETIARHNQYAERLDSLRRSQRFYIEDYEGEKDKQTYLAQISIEIDKYTKLLTELPKPQTLGTLVKADMNATYKAIAILLNDLRLYFQVDNIITTDGIINLCPLIVSEFPSLTLEEITICFAKAKKGHYRELYNRLDAAIIMGWLQQYNIERLQRLQERHYVTESHAKIDINNYRSDKPNNAELLQKAHAAIAIDEALKKIKK